MLTLRLCLPLLAAEPRDEHSQSETGNEIIKVINYQRQLWPAVKAGIGITVGTVVGNLIQGVLAISAVVVFLLTTWPQVYGS
jgi:hypothetical protein